MVWDLAESEPIARSVLFCVVFFNYTHKPPITERLVRLIFHDIIKIHCDSGLRVSLPFDFGRKNTPRSMNITDKASTW